MKRKFPTEMFSVGNFFTKKRRKCLKKSEYYNEDSERKDQADVIIAKHRNGPIDTITLFFEKRFTKFTTLDFTTE